MVKEKRVVIIGGGVTGLTAAHFLVSHGIAVTLVESSQELGGLAGSFTIDGRPVDRYYHFICREDHDLIGLVRKLKIEDKLSWREGGTGFFVANRMYGFNTPIDLLTFDPVPFSQRIRFGVHVLSSQLRSNWDSLDRVPAKSWLVSKVGREAYSVIWDPLLRIKFGKFHDQISAAWLWHRIHRVARSRRGLFGSNTYGFFEVGCFTLVEALLNSLLESSLFQLVRGRTVTKILEDKGKVRGVFLESKSDAIESESVISTVAVPNFLKLIPNFPEYTNRLETIEYLNVVCMLLMLDRAFTDVFWLNINDTRISFNGIVETTNLNPRQDLNGRHLIYIPFYLHHTDPRWTLSDTDLYQEYTHALRLIQPDFDASCIKAWWVFRDVHSQAVCRCGFANSMPGHETPVQGLYMTDSSQYYPEDRTVSASVRLGGTVASLVRSYLG